MFKKVINRVNFPTMEEEILKFWKEADIFSKTGNDQTKPPFILYEGPPTANGSPGIHHVLARVFKDIICRYKTMKGFRPLRKGGWDTHGLPVELEIERELGLKSKRDIEQYGIEKFNQKCQESVFRYVKEWERLTDRIGFWVDMEKPYVTMENSYIETGWWIFKNLWDNGLVYKGLKATPHCPRCVTSLSSHELALGYQENTPDPSVYVKFPLLDTKDNLAFLNKWDDLTTSTQSKMTTYFLSWTTTPWTLPSNTGLAVNADASYAIVEISDDANTIERLILAEQLVSKVIPEPHTVVGLIKGSDLKGCLYKPLYHPQEFGLEIKKFGISSKEPNGTPSIIHSTSTFETKVILGDFVSLDDGTGIVHIAPAFGDEDLSVGKQNQLNYLQPVDMQGCFVGDFPFKGKFVKQADTDIINDLEQRNLLLSHSTYYHTYPFCWRCKTPLLYYTKESWYIQTTALKEQLLSENQKINWYPEYIKEGRFGEWLRNGVDWAISRERYWGTPIPIWQCTVCANYTCIGNISDLKSKSGSNQIGDINKLDLHRPYIDQISINCTHCANKMYRIPEVMDAWFDSGAMPFAQWNIKSDTELQSLLKTGPFPAEYICEAVDQTRGWFYSLLAISTLLTGKSSYKNVICLGLILDEKGRKMSKSIGNVVNPWEILDIHGADATRWYLFTATQPGESRRFSQKLVGEVVRKFVLTLWNVYSFFVTYANIDKFDPITSTKGIKPTSELDRWIISELNTLIQQVDQCLNSYDPTNGGRKIQEFVDLLSNWYVRRSRRRFWKSENDTDKLSAYSTLYSCLVTLAKLMAPYTPFLSEELYQNLVVSSDNSAETSVHLTTFPDYNNLLVDEPLMRATRLAMKLCSMGRDARSRAGKKVRLPLNTLMVKTSSADEEQYLNDIKTQVLEELNIKQLILIYEKDSFYQDAHQTAAGATSILTNNYQVVFDSGYMVAIDTNITDELAEEGLARELIHRIQNMRRNADFQVTDRINCYLQGPKVISDVIGKFGDAIKIETLSNNIIEKIADDLAIYETQNLDNMEITLGVELSS
ncbi:isoleucine--tRNA ligase [SAR202 cluster bacterium AC-409-J13_OGT_754m]|nr:isoleucine--tRNA ligase [SAR202 cluster bacterium AC-409-J13_OGT_754m]